MTEGASLEARPNAAGWAICVNADRFVPRDYDQRITNNE
jgi:hypothetical protein